MDKSDFFLEQIRLYYKIACINGSDLSKMHLFCSQGVSAYPDRGADWICLKSRFHFRNHIFCKKDYCTSSDCRIHFVVDGPAYYTTIKCSDPPQKRQCTHPTFPLDESDFVGGGVPKPEKSRICSRIKSDSSIFKQEKSVYHKNNERATRKDNRKAPKFEGGKSK